MKRNARGNLLKTIGISLLLWFTLSNSAAFAQVVSSDTVEIGVIVNGGTIVPIGTTAATIAPTTDPSVTPTTDPATQAVSTQVVLLASTPISGLPSTGAEEGGNGTAVPYIAMILTLAGATLLVGAAIATRNRTTR